MSDIVIRAENIGKQFHIGALQKYDTLRDRLAAAFKPKGKAPGPKEEDIIWALKDVNFEIKQGEVVGVIGRNGAGKSTLLKILSKITEPTTGRVELHGRVGSLLEVGTGFHPELTGRENVFLNGAILGMKRAEIKRRFDEIVAFSEVEKFIDTPVKRYSSGMYMRLAFAVAAHLDPEILLVDEVLAVGDAQFQSKCLGKMGEVAKEGRTVLFVSHNMASITSLCGKGIYLLNGTVDSVTDNISEVISKYLQINDASIININERADRKGNGSVIITNIYFDGYESNTLITGKPTTLCLCYKSNIKQAKIKIHASIRNIQDQVLLFFDTDLVETSVVINNETGTFAVEIPDNVCLAKGSYYLNYTLYNNDEMLDHLTKAYQFKVVDGPFYHNGKLPNINPMINIKHKWYVK